MLRLNIPTIVTLLRLALLPVLILCFYFLNEEKRTVITILFIMVSVTDWLDGYLARKLDQGSKFGEFLDPVADKIAVSLVLALLIEEHASWVITIPAIIIIGREITISALREWMSNIGARAKVAVSTVGKIKTMAQMLAIIFLLYKSDLWFFPTEIVGKVLLYIAAILTLWSMLVYLRSAWPMIKDN